MSFCVALAVLSRRARALLDLRFRDASFGWGVTSPPKMLKGRIGPPNAPEDGLRALERAQQQHFLVVLVVPRAVDTLHSETRDCEAVYAYTSVVRILWRCARTNWCMLAHACMERPRPRARPPQGPGQSTVSHPEGRVRARRVRDTKGPLAPLTRARGRSPRARATASPIQLSARRRLLWHCGAARRRRSAAGRCRAPARRWRRRSRGAARRAREARR